MSTRPRRKKTNRKSGFTCSMTGEKRPKRVRSCIVYSKLSHFFQLYCVSAQKTTCFSMAYSCLSSFDQTPCRIASHPLPRGVPCRSGLSSECLFTPLGTLFTSPPLFVSILFYFLGKVFPKKGRSFPSQASSDGNKVGVGLNRIWASVSVV